MKRIERPNTPPQALVDGKSYEDKEVKEALEAMHHKKCCYCEAEHIKGEVEHFRPKGSEWYPWLINDWNNLLWTCHDCNNIKGTKLPVETKLADESDDVAECNRKEKLIVIDPSSDFDANSIRFTKDGSIYSSDPLMAKTIRICGLDRVNLNEQRQTVLNNLHAEINSIAFFASKASLKGHIWKTFITPLKSNPELGFTAFRKYILRHWLKEILSFSSQEKK